jgi:hypothetical protein
MLKAAASAQTAAEQTVHARIIGAASSSPPAAASVQRVATRRRYPARRVLRVILARARASRRPRVGGDNPEGVPG